MHRVLAIGLVGCGRFNFDDVVSSPDASVSSVDAAPLGSFGVPVRIGALAMAGSDDRRGTFTADLLELYFSSDRDGDHDIHVSTRAAPADPWGTPTRVVELSSTSSETGPGISADGLTIWFSSSRPGSTGGFDIWKSTRASRGDPWTTPVLIPELSSAMADGSPAPDPSGLVMYTIRGSDTAYYDADVYRSTRGSLIDPWSVPTPVAELNTSVSDGSGYVAAEQRSYYFSSNRMGGMGSWDIYQAERDISGTFEMPVVVVELSSTASEIAPWLSPDLRYVVFASTRAGSYQLFEASR